MMDNDWLCLMVIVLETVSPITALTLSPGITLRVTLSPVLLEMVWPFSCQTTVLSPRLPETEAVKVTLSPLEPTVSLEAEMVMDACARNTAVTDRGDIRGEKIIVATHFPFLNRYGAYFLKMYQQRSYVLALEEAAQVEGMYIEAEPGGLSFRNYGNLLLLGGGGHRTGKAGGGWEYLRREVQRYYPAARECYHWAAQDCMTLDGMAYVGPYSRGTRNLYVATGFHKWGMTGSMAAATLLRDMVLEKENPYARVFAPDRPMLRPQLGVNAWEATRSLLTFRTPRCPHLGCSLVWNPREHAWECPCHCSRCSQSGKILDNPALKNRSK